MKQPTESDAMLSGQAPACPACAMTALLSPSAVLDGWRALTRSLARLARVIPPLLLRLVLAYEFWEAGWMKLDGENWFQDLSFPFPFSLLSADINWTLATAFELLGPIALVLGIATRFVSLALMVLTWVAIATVHWPAEWHSWSELLQGYAITDQGYGNYKLPLLYLVMFVPLLFGGAGTLSVDSLWGKHRASHDKAVGLRASSCSPGPATLP